MMLLAVVACAGIMVISGLPEIAASATFVLFIMMVAKPQIGAYLFLLANPLIVGIERGKFIPFMRPNEALLLFILGAVSLHILLELLSGKKKSIRIGAIEVAFMILIAAGSVYPLLLHLMMEVSVSTDAVLYSIVLVKYFLLYAFFKKAIVRQDQLLACLIISMLTSTIVALIGFLQVKNLFSVPELLRAYYDNPWTVDLGVTVDRATSTLATSFGVADTMTMNMMIALALFLICRRSQVILLFAAIFFMGGCLSAGSFSGAIGLLVSITAFGFLTGNMLRIAIFGAPLVLAVGVLFSNVIAKRLAGFERQSGLPQSWEGRINNLVHYFLPDLSSGFSWLYGVHPVPRVVAPEYWRDFVYIESGYVWLLWIGGLPFFFAFLFFIWTCLNRLSVHVRTTTATPQKAAAIACVSYIWALLALTLFDPHFTTRGAADLFFPLLAISLMTQVRQDTELSGAIDQHRGFTDPPPCPAGMRR